MIADLKATFPRVPHTALLAHDDAPDHPRSWRHTSYSTPETVCHFYRGRGLNGIWMVQRSVNEYSTAEQHNLYRLTSTSSFYLERVCGICNRRIWQFYRSQSPSGMDWSTTPLNTDTILTVHTYIFYFYLRTHDHFVDLYKMYKYAPEWDLVYLPGTRRRTKNEQTNSSSSKT